MSTSVHNNVNVNADPFGSMGAGALSAMGFMSGLGGMGGFAGGMAMGMMRGMRFW